MGPAHLALIRLELWDPAPSRAGPPSGRPLSPLRSSYPSCTWRGGPESSRRRWLRAYPTGPHGEAKHAGRRAASSESRCVSRLPSWPPEHPAGDQIATPAAVAPRAALGNSVD